MNKFIFLILCCIFCSCAQNQNLAQNTQNSFCYWKTSYYESEETDSLMRKLNVNQVYLRLFDIDWNPYLKQALPVSTLRGWGIKDTGRKVFTPCIFITNVVFEHTSKSDLDTLAQRISKRVDETIEINLKREDFGKYDYVPKEELPYEKIEKIRDSIRLMRFERFRATIKDILIDCDWTEKTRDNYFYLLSQLKKEMKNYTITATIRLWQYKYSEKAGIPPVNRGLLMCYNMENHKKTEVNNSIGSAEELAKYLTNNDYKLDLDVALPIFQWSVLFSNGKYKGIISDLGKNVELGDTALFRAVGANKYIFKEEMEIGEYYIRGGDEIRVERVSPEELRKMATLIREKVRLAPNARISLFSWDKRFLDYYGLENLQKVFGIFK